MNAQALELYKKGMACYGEGRHADAIETYAQALQIEPDWGDCLQAMGMAQLNAELFDDALVSLKRVVELAPEDPLAYTSLSMVLMRLGDFGAAEDAQAKARNLSWELEKKTNPNAPPPGPAQ